MPYYVYMLLCEGDTFYTGYTKNRVPYGVSQEGKRSQIHSSAQAEKVSLY